MDSKATPSPSLRQDQHQAQACVKTNTRPIAAMPDEAFENGSAERFEARPRPPSRLHRRQTPPKPTCCSSTAATIEHASSMLSSTNSSTPSSTLTMWSRHRASTSPCDSKLLLSVTNSPAKVDGYLADAGYKVRSSDLRHVAQATRAPRNRHGQLTQRCTSVTEPQPLPRVGLLCLSSLSRSATFDDDKHRQFSPPGSPSARPPLKPYSTRRATSCSRSRTDSGLPSPPSLPSGDAPLPASSLTPTRLCSGS
ncbi:hypothetical protein ACFXTH_022462 [Malus domestica]